MQSRRPLRRARGLARRLIAGLGPWLLAAAPLAAAPPPAAAAVPTVLVVYEAGPTPVASGLGDALQLQQLLGHFSAAVTLLPSSAYRAGEIAKADVTFVIGFTKLFDPPPVLLRDAYAATHTLVWLNSGLVEFGRTFDLPARFGFAVERFDTTSGFDSVQAGEFHFTKTEPKTNVLAVTDPARCQVLATTTSSRAKLTVPYAVRSGSFWCIADSPFSYATESDRYLYFADLLHDILGQDHPRSHSALIRIEDTNPFSDPASLRAVADLLYARKIPFLVGVIPFYVNPASQTRVAMSEKPDYVDALHYMMEHGGTIVMHGVTHQYKGETATDYEFWDESGNRILPEDSREYVTRRLRDGVAECVKNGVYPLVWETPHYAASTLDYGVFAQHFSTAMEQRLVLDNLDFSQYFPYIIKRDIYGQHILPEDLGYVPLDPDIAKENASVDKLLSFAKVDLAVRDGFASAFFHPFLPIECLARLVDGIRALGYTFVDVREMSNSVVMDDRAIVSGHATVKLALTDQYLRESWIDGSGQLVRRELSPSRLRGAVERDVQLPPRWIYVAEPQEFRERPLSLWEKAKGRAGKALSKIFRSRRSYAPADAVALFDPGATGGAANDQASLAAPLQALSMPVEEVPLTPGLAIDTSGHNLVIVPYTVADQLTAAQVAALEAFVRGGGNLITDFRNDLATALGVRFFPSTLLIERVRDSLYPDEALRWTSGEVMNKFETADGDEILATDDVTGIAVVIGRRFGAGRFIFFGTRFDPASNGGYSRYPYLASEVGKFFGLTPLVRREQLEMFFDPGFRHTVSIEQLVTRWAAVGIRILHVGGWHQYAKWSYDYGKLIALCHANGILVYCWLEPPQVNQKFWQDHPEWREKNYKGEDVRPSWRYPVALTDPACLAAVTELYRQLLTGADWDGVDIGELYFEGGRGTKDPELFTPFHPSARREFRQKYGFDPVELFDHASPRYWRRDPAALAEFVKYRVDKNVQFHEAMLKMAQSVAREKQGFETVVTVLDSLADPELRTWLGVDARQIAALSAKYDFRLQVEDPERMWSTDPRRYQGIAARYAGLVDPAHLALDLNILSFRAENAITPFPTSIQTGTEAAWLVHSAALGARRVAIYSESSINQQDLPFLPSAYAARTKVTRSGSGWAIDTPTPIVLQLATDVQEAWRDGQRLRTLGRGRFLLPAGKYTVTPAQPTLEALQPGVPDSQLLSITGDLLFQKSSQRSVTFGYRSGNRCIATLARQPFALFVDGHETPLAVLPGNGRDALILPPGEHTVLLVTQSGVSYGVNITSFWSSYVIAIFGAVAVGLLVSLYLVVRVRPRRRTA